ncbi:MAG TPA: glycosyltransferase family 2 protein [Stellaceae bacterium]|jgi:dolichol-phosphate mannosyltransferase|nr:glycosyltransferase family 2 protein [Stellaceae bacterium]
MELSIVIPARNEAPNIAPLVAEIGAALDGIVSYEIVYVDDGSGDDTAGAIRTTMHGGAPVRLLRHARSCGQSSAVRSGVIAARAPWIATLDADGQNDPADIKKLWEMARASPTAGDKLLLAGFRQKRRDTAIKRLSSRIANSVRGAMLKDRTQDTGCGLKLLRRELYLALPFFDHNHRFLPALVLREGGIVQSVPVNHRPRQRGTSNYGLFDRLWVGIVDLFGVMWLQHRAKVPVLLAEEDETSVATPLRSTGTRP